MAPEILVQNALSAPVSPHNRGLLYGDGVFETIRCRNGKLLLWDLHLARLIRSCKTLGISLALPCTNPLPDKEADAFVAAIIASAPSSDCILKIIVTRGEGGRGYIPASDVPSTLILQWHVLPVSVHLPDGEGIDCFFCNHPLSINPATAGIKHLNRLDQVMASRELAIAAERLPGIREGLMSDTTGHLIEGTRSNLFAVIDGRLCTPDLQTAGVDGVMRQWLLSYMDSIGRPVEIRTMTVSDLDLASELFICNSVFGVWPVSRIMQPGNDSATILHQFTSMQTAVLARKALQEIFVS